MQYKEAIEIALRYLKKYFHSSYFNERHIEVKVLANLIKKNSNTQEQIETEWFDINKVKPEKTGWYAAALNPVNFDNIDLNSINSWRKSFGFTKAFYNRENGYWGEPNPHDMGSVDVFSRMTHWAELPKVPILIKFNNKKYFDDKKLEELVVAYTEMKLDTEEFVDKAIKAIKTNSSKLVILEAIKKAIIVLSPGEIKEIEELLDKKMK